MKIIFILLTAVALQVSAKGFTQTISLSVKDAPLEKVFESITNQSGYRFFYNDEQLQKSRPVTINIKKASLEDALNICLKDQSFTYTIINKVIVIKTLNKSENQHLFPSGLDNGEAVPIDVRGRVTNEKGEPAEGITVTIKGTNIATSTDENGEFSLSSVDPEAILVFTSVNMETFEYKVKGKTELVISLKTKISRLADVSVVVNTGYQKLKANEVTGSVVVITKEQLDQRVAPDIISKLEGITNGLVFNKRIDGKNELRIRGESTIYGYNNPLVIVDNFPYPFDRINDINPNDVENITILKDAAAASIWGSQAGNGVIVITTRRGKINQPMQVGLTVNTTITKKPDLFYSPLMSPSNYIDLERFYFSQGKYDQALSDPYLLAVSPVVEILDQRNRGLISTSDSASMIDALRTNDWRNQLLDHVYRNALTQQYQLNLRGGGDKSSYYFSAGYDKNLAEVIGNSSNRITLNSQTSYRPFKNFELQFGLGYSENSATNNGNSNISNLYPYTRLVDENGNALSVPQHRAIWEDTIMNHGFMDWKYYPLKEKDYTINSNKAFTTRLNIGMSYSILRGLVAQVSYQYLRSAQRVKNLRLPGSYYVRDKINQFAILSNDNNYTGTNYPKGGELYVGSSDYTGHDGRFQLNYERSWNTSSLSAIAGFQVSENRSEGNSSSFFGYNNDNGSYIIPDPYTYYPTYPIGNSVLPSRSPEVSGPDIKRFRSYFFNAAYTYQKKYAVSISARFDGSNIFGVKTNDKITPLWSVGGKWNISKEKFYNLKKLLPELSLRSSFGYNGNLSPDMVAMTTILYQGNSNLTGLPYAIIQNNPNPQLRWEKTGQFNIGLDWSMKGNKIAGSIEYYKKKGKDLIGSTPIDPTTGVSEIRGNFSDMKSTGWDIQINTQNINRKFKWNTSFIFNYALEKVTRYDLPSGPLTYKSAYIDNLPLAGYPLRSVFSYRWGGLDPNTGDPRIYLGDTLYKNYTVLPGNIKISDLAYSGRYNPPYTGSINNSFFWNGVSLAFSITYKLGHYFRRGSISYSQLEYDWRSGHSDFNHRWQKPGDENHTAVPSFVYPTPSNIRDDFYNSSDILVEKADHIRLQFINLSYNFNGSLLKKLKLHDLSVYFYVNNLNIIIWKANKKGIDPEYPYLNYPPSRTYSFGLRVDL